VGSHTLGRLGKVWRGFEPKKFQFRQILNLPFDLFEGQYWQNLTVKTMGDDKALSPKDIRK
jgi:hypothetical protein